MTIGRECGTDDKLQALLILLSLLAFAVQLNSAFNNAKTTYMCRRQASIEITESMWVQPSCLVEILQCIYLNISIKHLMSFINEWFINYKHSEVLSFCFDDVEEDHFSPTDPEYHRQ